MLTKTCSVCDSTERVAIETVTNVAPQHDDMFPVLLCAKCKTKLANGELDIRMDKKGDLVFISKKKH